MKKLFIYLSILLFAACSEPKEVSGPFDWLLGTWLRSDDAEGRQTYEDWKKLSNDIYHGHGYTLVGADTVWQERMILSEVEAAWQFKVIGKDNTVAFAVSAMGKEDFICKNPEHDFPKKISYRLGGDTLRAVISGGKDQVVFSFGRP
jgi:hypothetical protein